MAKDILERNVRRMDSDTTSKAAVRPPKQVVMAVLLIVASLVAGGFKLAPGAYSYPAMYIVYTVVALFLYRMYKGANWARWTFIVFLMLCVTSSTRYLGALGHTTRVYLYAYIAQFVLQMAACVLLLVKPASDWFSRNHVHAASVSGGANNPSQTPLSQ